MNERQIPVYVSFGVYNKDGGWVEMSRLRLFRKRSRGAKYTHIYAHAKSRRLQKKAGRILMKELAQLLTKGRYKHDH